MSNHEINGSLEARLKDETARLVPPTTQVMLAGINAGMANGRKKARIQRTLRAALACAAVILVLGLGVFYVMEAGWLGEGDKIGMLSPGEVVVPELGVQPQPINNANPSFVPARDFEVWRQQYSEDIIAWIRLEGTAIDFPIVQSTDNDFYLHRTPDGQVSEYGSIFMDYRNAPDFSHPNTFIYGHNTTTGGMFAPLMQYQYQWFYEMFPVISIYTPYMNYELKIFAAYVMDNYIESPYMRHANAEAFYANMDHIITRSFITSAVRPVFGDRIVYLVTCTNANPQDRMLVVGILMEAEAPCNDIEAPLDIQLGEWWNDYTPDWPDFLYNEIDEPVIFWLAAARARELSQFSLVQEGELPENLEARRFVRAISSHLDNEALVYGWHTVDGELRYRSEEWVTFQRAIRDYAWARLINEEEVSGRIDSMTCGDFLLGGPCGGYLFIEQRFISFDEIPNDPLWGEGSWSWHPRNSQVYTDEEGRTFIELRRSATINIYCSYCDFQALPHDTARYSMFYNEFVFFHFIQPE